MDANVAPGDRHPALMSAERALAAVEAAAAAISVACILAILAIVFTDVALRYALNSPLLWSYDVVSRYLLVSVFYFSLSNTLGHEEHIRVLFVRRFLNGRTKAIADFACYLATALLVAVIVWLSVGRAYHEWANEERFVGSFLWPTWITSAVVALGTAFLVLRLLLMAFRRLLDVPAGHPDRNLDMSSAEDKHQ